MNLKPIELQMAIPRATEVGKVQQQTQQKPQTDQTLMQQMAAKQTEIEQKKAPTINESNNERVRDEERDQKRRNMERKRKMKGYKKSQDAADKESEQARHPFLGNNLDLTL